MVSKTHRKDLTGCLVTSKAGLVKETKRMKVETCLHSASGNSRLRVEATNGRMKRFLNLDSESVFCDWSKDCEPHSGIQIRIYRITATMTFREIFAGMEADFEDLCLTPCQIEDFVQKHPKWFPPKRFKTFFFFLSEGRKLVASVSWKEDHQTVTVYDFLNMTKWNKRLKHRIIVPVV